MDIKDRRLKTELAEVIALRKNGQAEEALKILDKLLVEDSQHPDINYQMAWTMDSLGRESEAVPFYEKSIANGLVEDRSGALLGLGSTYRCLGEYEKSIKIFDQAVHEFPENRGLRVFRSLTLYNLGKLEDSFGELLTQLLDTTNDATIRLYDRALRFYSDKLSETWK